jgi:hypothetical protein
MCTVHGYEIEIISIHKVNLPNCKISELLDLTYYLVTWEFRIGTYNFGIF